MIYGREIFLPSTQRAQIDSWMEELQLWRSALCQSSSWQQLSWEKEQFSFFTLFLQIGTSTSDSNPEPRTKSSMFMAETQGNCGGKSKLWLKTLNTQERVLGCSKGGRWGRVHLSLVEWTSLNYQTKKIRCTKRDGRLQSSREILTLQARSKEQSRKI